MNKEDQQIYHPEDKEEVAVGTTDKSDSGVAAGDVVDEDLPEDVHHGDALNVREGYEITSSVECRMIGLAGPVNSGKTTLIAALFHLFQRGDFADYLFCGSKTLVGFDKRCHMARVSSGLDDMYTLRTRPGEERNLLHLRVRHNTEGSQLKDLLFLDLSGEDFRDAKNSIDDCSKLTILKRCDHFVLLIDGAKLAKVEERQSAFSDSTMLLRACLDSGVLTNNSRVDIVITKLDILKSGSEPVDSAEFMANIKESTRSRFGNRVHELRFMQVAARPKCDRYKLGYGLAELFPDWVTMGLGQPRRFATKPRDAGYCGCDRFLTNDLIGSDG